MSIIHIETNLIAKDIYEFIQTFVVGEINVEERTFQERHEDRMVAAMTNLGYACKWFADKNYTRGSIVIVTDTDGKDKRYNGEHDDLFKAIRSQRDYQVNRAKYALIYGRYVKFLDRIRELANAYEIGFTQNAEVLLDIQTSDNPYLIANQKWTRENIIKISLTGMQNTVICNACQKSIQYQQTDTFAPFRMYCGKDLKGNDRYAMVKNNKSMVKNFQEIHLGMHLNRGL